MSWKGGGDRCWNYDDDGTPIQGGCRKKDCWHVHPSDPGWETAKSTVWRRPKGPLRSSRRSPSPPQSRRRDSYRSPSPAGSDGSSRYANRNKEPAKLRDWERDRERDRVKETSSSRAPPTFVPATPLTAPVGTMKLEDPPTQRAPSNIARSTTSRDPRRQDSRGEMAPPSAPRALASQGSVTPSPTMSMPPPLPPANMLPPPPPVLPPPPPPPIPVTPLRESPVSEQPSEPVPPERQTWNQRIKLITEAVQARMESTKWATEVQMRHKLKARFGPDAGPSGLARLEEMEKDADAKRRELKQKVANLLKQLSDSDFWPAVQKVNAGDTDSARVVEIHARLNALEEQFKELSFARGDSPASDTERKRKRRRLSDPPASEKPIAQPAPPPPPPLRTAVSEEPPAELPSRLLDDLVDRIVDLEDRSNQQDEHIRELIEEAMEARFGPKPPEDAMMADSEEVEPRRKRKGKGKATAGGEDADAGVKSEIDMIADTLTELWTEVDNVKDKSNQQYLLEKAQWEAERANMVVQNTQQAAEIQSLREALTANNSRVAALETMMEMTFTGMQGAPSAETRSAHEAAHVAEITARVRSELDPVLEATLDNVKSILGSSHDQLVHGLWERLAPVLQMVETMHDVLGSRRSSAPPPTKPNGVERTPSQPPTTTTTTVSAT